jgi:hypothetical protein
MWTDGERIAGDPEAIHMTEKPAMNTRAIAFPAV